VNKPWPIVQLDSVADIERESVQAGKISSGSTYVGLENITSDGEFLKVTEVEAGELGSSKFLFSKDHVLYGKLRPYLRKIARPSFSGICSTDIVPIRPGPGLDKGYLFHYLRTPTMVDKATTMSVGVNLPRLSPSTLAIFQIPLPPIEEQRRIAAILDKADEIRTKRRAALVQLDTLTQAIFLDLFGDPVSNPKGWPDRRVDGALDFLTYGHRFYDQLYSDEGTPIVRITDLNESGDLDFPSMPRMTITEQERLTYRVNAGDLLFARSGATVGKVALLREGDPECVGGAYFIWMRFTDEVNPEYARSVLTSDRVRELIVKQSRQAAQQNFSGPAIRRLPMPIPPADLQTQYAEIIQCVSTQKKLLSGGLASANNLFASLQHRAFRGEL
jgi:type I restriction enzyme, S subunit